MKSLFLALAVLIATPSLFAGPKCTDEPESKWRDQDKFKADLVASGYKIKLFKVTSGNCYEIYGWDSKGQKVEIYFHPISGNIVKIEKD